MDIEKQIYDAEPYYETSDLLHFTKMNDMEQVEKILDAGLWVDTSNYMGQTALMIACKEGHNLIVELLLNRGAAEANIDNGGNTPLDYCYRSNNIHAARLIKTREMKRWWYQPVEDKKRAT